jgi:predicted DNA-binding antitoxin AbrB/MazE fold protein
MIVKAIYENNLLRPQEKLDLKEGEEVDLEIMIKGIFVLLKDSKLYSQSLKDELRETDG